MPLLAATKEVGLDDELALELELKLKLKLKLELELEVEPELELELLPVVEALDEDMLVSLPCTNFFAFFFDAELVLSFVSFARRSAMRFAAFALYTLLRSKR